VAFDALRLAITFWTAHPVRNDPKWRSAAMPRAMANCFW
jgi:hypothetical protein